MPYDVDAAADWLDDWVAGVGARAERAATLSRRVAALTGSAESPDGSVRVTVEASGRISKLSLSDEELARRVLAVTRRAQADLAGQVAVQVAETVGADTETGAGGAPLVHDPLSRGRARRWPVSRCGSRVTRSRDAGSVDRVADAMRTARSAVHDVTMDTAAYGMLCRFLPGALSPVLERGLDALAGSIDGLDETAAALRATVAGMAGTDRAAADRIKAVG